ncbi:alpha/beta hydrolase family protein [Shewanella schlegeliana]|uniref:DUF3530 family protein n=1 Tax=Shewanella schlegeliana TaxID=190308 RepID=A0ABS1SWN1_9GAMM|nr:DUF3530 family protein [Shewanella schlegeliana]MBL4912956.1 DUF3530 family protein [Shewanella schlegeliana]MCL1108948.1 alpha/beta hydrolase family protein [Shewanella schlegeliana]
MKLFSSIAKPLSPVYVICGVLVGLCSFMVSASNADYSYLPASEVKQLQVENQSIPALLRPWLGKKQLGLAIIVPPLGERADAPGLASYLRRELNSAGWATLALTPPMQADIGAELKDKDAKIVVANTPDAQQDTAAETPIENQNIQMHSPAQEAANVPLQQHDFMLASMAQLDALGKHFAGKRMLVTMGDSANLIIELLETHRLPKPDLMVIVNPYSELESANQALPKKLAKLSIPVLDIQSKDGTAQSLATQMQRLTLAPENAPHRYSQQVLALDLTLKVTWDDCLELIEGFARRINKAHPNG